MSCEECSKKPSNNKISIFFQNNKNVKTTVCKSCNTCCQPNMIYCILCANRLGLCQKCGKKIFDNSMYKYSDMKWKDYLRKRTSKKISTEINDRLVKKLRLDQLRPKQPKKKKKSPIKIKVTNYSFNNMDLKDSENGDIDKTNNDKNKKKKSDKKNEDSEIKFFEEQI